MFEESCKTFFFEEVVLSCIWTSIPMILLVFFLLIIKETMEKGVCQRDSDTIKAEKNPKPPMGYLFVKILL